MTSDDQRHVIGNSRPIPKLVSPTDTQVLTWDATDGYWKPSTPASSYTKTVCGGDLSNTYPNPTVSKVKWHNITTAGWFSTYRQSITHYRRFICGWGAVDLANSSAITGTLPRQIRQTQIWEAISVERQTHRPLSNYKVVQSFLRTI